MNSSTISIIPKFSSILLIAVIWGNCTSCSNDKATQSASMAPGATGDSLALVLAEKVATASGGIENWNRVPFIRFDYFDSRLWYWDKWKNRYRVESEKRNFRIAGTLDGQVTHLWLNGSRVTTPDSIARYRDLAYRAWINDTYWLILPFKLNDPGLHIKYLGKCMADSVKEATCLELTFDSVGVTPLNKYTIYIDTLTDRIIHWDHYRNKSDSIPSSSVAWTDYQSYGRIVLASGRGDRSFTGIQLFESLPNQIFTDVSLSAKEITDAQDVLIYKLLK